MNELTSRKSLKDRIVRLKEDVVTKMTIGILKPFNRHRMVHLDHVRTDAENPLVRGCYVEVIYADAPEKDVYPAETVTVLNDKWKKQFLDEEWSKPIFKVSN